MPAGAGPLAAPADGTAWIVPEWLAPHGTGPHPHPARGCGQCPPQPLPMFQKTVAGARNTPVTLRRQAEGCQ